ncbi:MAG: hypothetical protein AAGF28_02520 [Pseudomonadota bacterium]
MTASVQNLPPKHSGPRDWSKERRAEQPVHVLFVGAALAGTKSIFKRRDEVVRCEHAPTPAIALDMITTQAQSRPFDCVMIDMRRETDGSPLNVFPIAALRACGQLTILARPADVKTYEEILGVDQVLAAPVNPQDIMATIIDAAPIYDEAEPEFVPIQAGTASDAEPEVPQAEPGESRVQEGLKSVTKGFESSLSTLRDADQQIWQKFLPLANFLYKKLAIIVLSALFLTFVAYGSMIVFFMSSSSWSLPFELSRGHLLVEKVERDLSSMRVRRNQLSQDLTQARVEAAKADRDGRDAKLRLTLTERTVEAEILLQTDERLEIRDHIDRLKKVIADFNQLNSGGGFAKNLETAFAKRLITRKALNSGTLAVLETLHRMATVQNEISVKQMELQKVTQRLEFLRTLQAEIKQPEVRVVTSAGADLAYLAREVIESKNQIAIANRNGAAANKRVAQLENSLSVMQSNLDSLSATPAARAIEAPVMVLFVPYTNAADVTPGEPLYGCALSFFFCSRVGEVGAAVDGETTAVHPLFGKPMRGTFVEAKFADPRSVTEEIVHAGRSPLLF